MANKTLKTRIQNKFGSATEWAGSSLQLLKGELAIMPIAVAVDTGSATGTGLEDYTAGYMIKVGDGTSTFANAKGLVAYAADVHSWAKASEFNEGTYGTNATDGNLPKTHAAIKALQDAIGGSGSVASMISAAIDALDVEDEDVTGKFVSVVSETNGKISVSRKAISADDIKTAIAGLNREDFTALHSALNTIEDNISTINGKIGGSYTSTKTVYGDIAGVKTRVETLEGDNTTNKSDIAGLTTRMGTAEGKITTAEGDIDSLEGRMDTAETDIDNLEAALAGYTGSGAVAAEFTKIDTSIGNLETADTGLDNRIKAIEGVIGGVTGAMHFVGAFAEAPSKAFTGTDKERNLADGDVYVNTSNHKEYVYSGTEWVELGDVTEEAQRISTLEGDVAGLKAADTRLDTAITNEESARKEADNTLQGNINTLSGTVNTLTTNNTAAHTTLQGNIDAINNKIGGSYDATNTVSKAISDVNAIASTAKTKAETLEDVLADYSGSGAVKTAVDAAAAAAANAQKDVDDLEKAVGTSTDASNASTVYGALAKHAEDAAATYATQKALKDATDDITAIENKYVYSDGTNLLNANGETIIFDCGGVE